MVPDDTHRTEIVTPSGDQMFFYIVVFVAGVLADRLFIRFRNRRLNNTKTEAQMVQADPVELAAEQERLQQVREKAEERQIKLHEKNMEREKLVRDYVTTHRLALYYNTINGVTAVMVPTDHAQAFYDTEAARIDGKWKHSMPLPTARTFLFVTEEGTGYFDRQDWMGWRSQLEAFAREYNITLELHPEILVPYVHSIEFPGRRQQCTQTKWWRYELVESQMPPELRPRY